jgi:hypothetical protein
MVSNWIILNPRWLDEEENWKYYGNNIFSPMSSRYFKGRPNP